MPQRYESMLRQCRLSFTHDDRKLRSWKSRRYLKIKRPKWFPEQDGLRVLFQGWKALYGNGQVVWGRIVMTEEHLYKPGKRDGCAVVVFPAQPTLRMHPRVLREAADRLFELRFGPPDDFELKGVAKALADDKRRMFGLSVPSRLAPAAQLLISSTLLLRKHMPEGMVGAELLPLIVNTEWPHLAIMLPSAYWPSELIDLWHNGEEGISGALPVY